MHAEKKKKDNKAVKGSSVGFELFWKKSSQAYQSEWSQSPALMLTKCQEKAVSKEHEVRLKNSLPWSEIALLPFPQGNEKKEERNERTTGEGIIIYDIYICIYNISDQIRSVAQPCLTLCDPMNGSTPHLPVHHQLPEFTQTHVHQVSDAIQPSHSLSSPSPPAPNPFQHQSLFQWVNSSHEVAKVLEFQL